MSAGLRSFCGRVEELLADVRRVAHRLHPSILDNLRLEAALRSYCAEFSKLEGIQVNDHSRNLPESFPEDAALCLYRVTQEGLRNVARHAKTKKRP